MTPVSFSPAQMGRGTEAAADSAERRRIQRFLALRRGEPWFWVVIDGERCYRKFSSPSAIHLVVAGGTAGKFSAVIGGWSAGPRGSQMVT